MLGEVKGWLIGCDECRLMIKPSDGHYFCLICAEEGEWENTLDVCITCQKQGKHNPQHALRYFPPVKGDKNFYLRRGPTTAKTVHSALIAYQKLPFAGLYNKEKEKVEYICRQDFTSLIQEFGSGLLSLWKSFTPVTESSSSTDPPREEHELSKRKSITILSSNSLEWLVTEYAALLYDMVHVPLSINFDTISVQNALAQTESPVLVISAQQLHKLNAMVFPHTLRLVVVIGSFDPKSLPKHENCSVMCVSYDDVMEIGRKETLPFNIVKERDPTRIVSVSFTSGSTGAPKGILITDEYWNHDISLMYLEYSIDSVAVSFEPFYHMSERLGAAVTLINGGRTVIVDNMNRDLLKITSLVRPTSFSAIPRFWNMLYQEFMNRMEEKMRQYNAIPLEQRKQMEDELEKEMDIWTEPETPEQRIRKEVNKEIRSVVMGGRLIKITTGSAPTSDVVLNWMKECFTNVSAREGYGISEVGHIATDGRVMGCEVKVVDVPEMGYYAANGVGELWVRKQRMARGYFRADQANKDAYSEDDILTLPTGEKIKWFKTGDIVEYDSERNTVKVIDRIKNYFKLSQGEWVTPENIEGILGQSLHISGVWVHGSSNKSYVVAVVLPNPERYDKNCNIEQMKKNIVRDFERLGRGAELKNYEVPRNLIIDTEVFEATNKEDKYWTQENGRLTGPMKLNRPYFRKNFKEPVEELYKNTEVQTKLKLIRILKEKEGVDVGMKNNEDEEEQEGGVEIDSLATLRIASVLEREFELKDKVPLEYIRTGDLNKINEFIQNRTSEATATVTDAEFWRKETTLDPETAELLKRNSQHFASEGFPSQNISTVLLTGATGFLGAHILQHLLTSSSTSIIYCLVRMQTNSSSSHSTPFDRIQQSMVFYKLWEDGKQQELYRSRIKAISGDLKLPNFGLSGKDYDELIQSALNLVIHNGCHVNGVYSYQALSPANVLGTQHALKIAAKSIDYHNSKKDKTLSTSSEGNVTTSSSGVHFIFISSVSALNGVQKTEDKVVYPYNPLLGDIWSKVGGYPASKAVAESIVWSASNYPCLTTSVIRPGNISGSSITGALNPIDFTTRFLATCIQVHAVPSGQMVSERVMDMVPVDKVVDVIGGVMKKEKSVEERCWNVWKPAVEIGELGEWMRECGWKVNELGMEEWRKEVFDGEKGRRVELEPLRSYFEEASGGGLPVGGAEVDCSNTNRLLGCGAIGKGGGYQWGEVTKELFGKYLNNLVERGVIVKE